MREASSCGRFSETENSSNFSSVSAAAGIRVLSESGNPAKACEMISPPESLTLTFGKFSNTDSVTVSNRTCASR